MGNGKPPDLPSAPPSRTPAPARTREAPPAHQPPMCECGHPAGSHKSAGTSWPHPPRYGVCLTRGCPCREFTEAPA